MLDRPGKSIDLLIYRTDTNFIISFEADDVARGGVHLKR